MIILMFIAAVSLLLGLLFLANAQALKRLSELLNKVIIEDKDPDAWHSKLVGAFLIVFSFAIIFVALKLRR